MYPSRLINGIIPYRLRLSNGDYLQSYDGEWIYFTPLTELAETFLTLEAAGKTAALIYVEMHLTLHVEGFQ